MKRNATPITWQDLVAKGKPVDRKTVDVGLRKRINKSHLEYLKTINWDGSPLRNATCNDSPSA